jgi:UPF0755 protein
MAMSPTARFFLSLLSVGLLAGGGVAALGGYGAHLFFAPGKQADNKMVMIDRGMGTGQIADRLQAEGVVSSALVFKIAARLKADQGTLKAGEYEFPAHVPMARALEMLQKGEVFDRKFTIVEGMTSHQILRVLQGVPELEGGVDVLLPEGSLLPQTYTFIKGETRAQKIAEMKTAMDHTWDELWPRRQPDLPFQTREQALTLASIVEKETGVASERRRIAGVFVNRLKRGIPLQTDPTVIYALTKGDIKEDGMGPLGRRLLTKDLAFDSPYNTYRYAGLPPGPICHPGRAAVEAALNPEIHDDLFFVADGTGGHVFAQTLEAHNRNVAQWRKIRKTRQSP